MTRQEMNEALKKTEEYRVSPVADLRKAVMQLLGECKSQARTINELRIGREM